MAYGYNPLAGINPPSYLPNWGMNGDAGGSFDPSGIGGYGSNMQVATSMGGQPANPMMTMGSPKLGLNMGTANLALTGLSTIGNLWAAFQAQKLARQQFEYTKNVTDTNLANQIKTYNTTLTDRANNRSKVEGHDANWANSYISSNSLKRYGT